MTEGRNVISDREASAGRLLTAISTVSDASLEQALDTDTREKYEALEEKTVLATEPTYIKIFKVMGAVAACFFLVMMLLPGTTTDGVGELPGNVSDNDGSTSEYPIEDIRTYRVMYDGVWYQSVTDPALLREYGLPESVTEDRRGNRMAYLSVDENGTYIEAYHVTDMHLYTCKDREDVYILHDENKELWVFVIPVEE